MTKKGNTVITKIDNLTITSIDVDTWNAAIDAVEWLVVNDPIVRSAYEHAKRSPAAAILIAADYGALLDAKIAEAITRMEVTEQDRKHGYNSRLYI